MSDEYVEMLRIQKIRQAEVAAWRQEQNALDDARALEVISINRIRSLPPLPLLSEPMEEEDAQVEVSIPSIEIEMPKPKTKAAKPAS